MPRLLAEDRIVAQFAVADEVADAFSGLIHVRQRDGEGTFAGWVAHEVGHIVISWLNQSILMMG